MALTAFRRFGFTSMEQVDRLELPEYRLMIKADNLRTVDREYELHAQAFLNMAVRARRGKRQTPVYKTFKKFFDYDALLKKVKDKKKTNDMIHNVSRILKERKKGRRNNG